MFTGIVDHCGTVTSCEKTPGSLVLTISCRFDDMQEGESIAVDGACLTAIGPRAHEFRADVSPETVSLTRVGEYEVGAKVNLERALRFSDRLGGHLVTGHVDQTGQVTAEWTAGEYRGFRVGGVSPTLRRFLTKKGSVTVNGVSLTVNELTDDGFEIMLIPHTLERTNLSELAPGRRVNLELDWMTKVILTDADRIHGATR